GPGYLLHPDGLVPDYTQVYGTVTAHEYRGHVTRSSIFTRRPSRARSAERPGGAQPPSFTLSTKSARRSYQAAWSAGVKWALAGLGFGTTKRRVAPMTSGCGPSAGARSVSPSARARNGR